MVRAKDWGRRGQSQRGGGVKPQGAAESLTGETPFQSPSILSVRTTLRSTATILTLPDLRGQQELTSCGV